MSNFVLSSETRNKLLGVATPTIATALFKRGLRNQFIQDVHPYRRRRRTWSARPLRCAIFQRAKT